ncbi:hypothetical protein [Streptomyces sp. NPDC127112]|uniref:hypothetical protein n=1 Tax=Streptomyces sp. NPDC127112 TaxID=3345364 RepID=UPI0036257846
MPTDRESVRQGWVDRNFRRFLGIARVRIRETTTGHADLHWANLTCAPLVLLDWENWGRLPIGYDLGLLHAYSLAARAAAARIRRESAHVLDTDADRTGELVALAQLLQACSRGVHPTLAPLIARERPRQSLPARYPDTPVLRLPAPGPSPLPASAAVVPAAQDQGVVGAGNLSTSTQAESATSLIHRAAVPA